MPRRRCQPRRSAGALTGALTLAFAVPACAAAAAGERDIVGPAAARHAVEGLFARAEVEGPSGRFTTEIVSLADGRARFVQVHADRRAEIVVAAGGGAFQRAEPGVALASASPATASFVHGHDVHRLVLGHDTRPERLEVPLDAALGGGAVTIELSGWRALSGLELTLPFAADFVHGGERWAYRYTDVLPFRMAPGVELPTDPEALFARLGDLAALVAAHARVMDAHRTGDADLLVADAAEAGTTSGRGRLTASSRAATLERMRGYLASIRFARYEDTALPVVAVSADGTLGWLACEIEAEGRTVVAGGGAGEPVAYAFSWVELYARAAGEPAAPWRAVGNASSVRP